MARRLHAAAADFEEHFRLLLAGKPEIADAVEAAVLDIVGEVRRRGDAAVVEYTRRFDGANSGAGLRVGRDELEAAAELAPPDVVTALTFARDRIEAWHARQRPADDRLVDALGVELGSRWTPVDSVGVYVPGGTASYPSSVLMNVIPARVAGVPRIAMAAPSPGGALNPLLAAAARLAGVDEIYRMGGAQAIAALAYGTESVAAVDKIVGPGNAYVAAAKRHVFGTVGIDMLAGPSEVLIVADAGAEPAWVAADLLAQAEHDPAARAVLITDDEKLADAVEAALERQLAALPRAAVAAASWRDFGAVIVVERIADSARLVNRLAPEHLELAVADPDALLPLVRHAGAIFLGRHSPEAIGDYVAGSNHVLPTARSARFSSGLSVLDFMKRTSLLRLNAGSLAALAPAATALAEAEGFAAHARSIGVRLVR